MHKRALSFGVLTLILVGAGCTASTTGSVSAPAPQPAAQAPAPAPAGGAGVDVGLNVKTNVAISGFAFQTKTLKVKKGTTVVWTNSDSMAHTVTADDASFDSGTMASGATYSHTFAQTGTFAYHCALHPSMKATVIVE